MHAGPDAPVQLAEVVAALSLATDFGTGHPIERSLRSCLLAVAFGEAIGLRDAELHELFYVTLLRWVGCTADPHRAQLFGDEIALGPQIDAVELWNAPAMLAFLLEHIGKGEPPFQRVGKLGHALATGIQRSQTAAVAHCEVGQTVAQELGLHAGVCRALGQVFERWDGKGVPGEAKGEALALSTRIMQIAMDAELFYRLGGAATALTVVRDRAGGFYDPSLAERFCRVAPGLLSLLDEETVWDRALAAEPGPSRTLSSSDVDAALGAIADFGDLRLPFTTGHSRAVAALAADAAKRAGLSEDEVWLSWAAGLVHDVGMVTISITVIQKPSVLTPLEIERVRLHPYYTERILVRTAGLTRVGALAALHHERLDASGYHRRLPGALLPPAARLLAAAEVNQALIEPRPHRPAFPPERASTLLIAEANAGRMDGDAVRAVLAAAGFALPRQRRTQPAGLSEREVEVLHLIVCGLSKREMAARLVISERTVDHHVRHIYDKLGVSSRAAATMFAMRHGIAAADL
ncbi:MAG: 3'3'-cGAMP-specific phosphodiesterase 3 [Dehalococcoidia bacterium]|nr:MAG: 3'3'-cGAMP-specific phosphodiesterase 3 [Dehalococcoidia bacterium]